MKVEAAFMKRPLCLLVALMLLISILHVPVYAGNNIKVYLNGSSLQFDVPAQLINGRTMVPMRTIFEALGATVEWDGNTQTITANKNDIKIFLQINKNIMVKNGAEILLDVTPIILNDRTLVPVRAVAESFNADVQWSDLIKTVVISTDTPTYKDYPNVIDYGKFMGSKLLSEKIDSDAQIYLYGLDGESDMSKYYYALENLGYKLTDSIKTSDSMSLQFTNATMPITEVVVYLLGGINQVWISIHVNGKYNETIAATLKNTFVSVKDIYLYENSDGEKFVKCSDVSSKLGISGFTVRMLSLNNGIWKIEEYDGMKDVSRILASGEYKLFDGVAYMKSDDFANYVLQYIK